MGSTTTINLAEVRRSSNVSSSGAGAVGAVALSAEALAASDAAVTKTLADQVFGANGLHQLQRMARESRILMIRVSPRNYLGLSKGRRSISPLRIDDYLFIFAPGGGETPVSDLAPLAADLMNGGMGMRVAIDNSETSLKAFAETAQEKTN